MLEFCHRQSWWNKSSAISDETYGCINGILQQNGWLKNQNVSKSALKVQYGSVTERISEIISTITLSHWGPFILPLMFWSLERLLWFDLDDGRMWLFSVGGFLKYFATWVLKKMCLKTWPCNSRYSSVYNEWDDPNLLKPQGVNYLPRLEGEG